MKRIFASLAIVAVVCLLSTTAHAVGRYSYNSTSFSPVKIVRQGYHGTYHGQTQVKTEYNWRLVGTCLVFERTTWTESFYVTYEWGNKVDSGVERSEPETQTVTEICF